MNTERFRTIVGYMAMWFLVIVVFSCSNEDNAPFVQPETPETSQRVGYEAVLNFANGKPVFDQAGETRAYSNVWPDGARLYLQFYNGSSRVDGLAVYSSATDSWSVNYYGTIAKGVQSTCEVYYFENAGTVTYESVDLTPETAVFFDKAGTYIYENGTVILSAQLAALTGRLRWKGTASQEFSYTGLTCYIGYNIATNTLSTQDAEITQTVSTDGYSPYVYGTFTDALQLTVESDEAGEVAYCKTFDSSVLARGKSGFMNVPVMESCNGWTIVTPETTKTFTVSGVSFNMIRVKKGTFTMGATSEQTGAFSDEKPAHTVTLTSSYYMGETEVTQELYQAVVGSNPSTYSGTQKPVTDVSWNDCQTFITKLNNLTGLTFRLPTEAEWEYAARGGSKSKGYQYSGSNTIGDVAYYLDNNEFFCSGATNVKSKSPNELGLYDMSGNVSEWCQDWYGSYSSSAQTNPTGPTSGSSRVIRGGAFVSYAWGCRVANRGSFTPSYACNNNGFRLVLSGFH